MDWAALVLMAAWLGVTAVFGFGWVRSGNAHWRWRWLRNAASMDKMVPMGENAALYGLIALAAVCNAVLYGIIGFRMVPLGQPSAYLARTLGQFPLLCVFLGVAIIRKPWRR